ncbi:hypothetical protein BC332_17987 [Capsicum chinense]|nr:hypothetical protein BC332_17987 [Capsicum chinense]
MMVTSNGSNGILPGSLNQKRSQGSDFSLWFIGFAIPVKDGLDHHVLWVFRHCGSGGFVYFGEISSEKTILSPVCSSEIHNYGLLQKSLQDFIDNCDQYESFNFSIGTETVGGVKLCSYAELQEITDNFDSNRCIRKTLCGRLFRGTIGEGSEKRSVFVKTWDFLLPYGHGHVQRPFDFCEMNIKLFDFGPAPTRLYEKNNDMTIKCHPGREAPDRGYMSTKSDVYVFGMLLVELIAKKEFDHSFFYTKEGGKKNVVDESFREVRMTSLTYICTETKPEERPTMKDVLDVLTEAMKMEAKPTGRNEKEMKMKQ